MNRLLLNCGALFLLAGCNAEYKDVSGASQYQSLMNQTFVTKTTLNIYGVSRQEDYGDTVDVYVVSPIPGFEGPEVVMRDKLVTGTTMRVTSVLLCENCIPRRRKFVVNLLTTILDPNAPVELVDIGICDEATDQCVLDTEIVGII